MALAEEQVGGVWSGPTSWLRESYEGCITAVKPKDSRLRLSRHPSLFGKSFPRFVRNACLGF